MKRALALGFLVIAVSLPFSYARAQILSASDIISMSPTYQQWLRLNREVWSQEEETALVVQTFHENLPTLDYAGARSLRVSGGLMKFSGTLGLAASAASIFQGNIMVGAAACVVSGVPLLVGQTFSLAHRAVCLRESHIRFIQLAFESAVKALEDGKIENTNEIGTALLLPLITFDAWWAAADIKKITAISALAEFSSLFKIGLILRLAFSPGDWTHPVLRSLRKERREWNAEVKELGSLILADLEDEDFIWKKEVADKLTAFQDRLANYSLLDDETGRRSCRENLAQQALQ